MANAFEKLDKNFPDGGIWALADTDPVVVAVPVGATLVYAYNATPANTVIFDPTGEGTTGLPVSSTAGTLVWSGPRNGGRRTFSIQASAGSTNVHIVAFGGV